MGVRNDSRSWLWTRSSSRRTGFCNAVIDISGFMGEGVRVRRTCVSRAGQDTGVVRRVSSAGARIRSLCGAVATPFLEPLEQPLAGVLARVLEHAIEQRL